MRDLKEWDLLRDKPLSDIKATNTGMPIRANKPKSLYVLEQRSGSPDDSYAVKGPLGKVILEPTSYQLQNKPRAYVLHVTTTEFAKSLEGMLSFQFVEEASIKRSVSEDDKMALLYMNLSKLQY
nr:unnamed protein product [Fasciola hepatica]